MRNCGDVFKVCKNLEDEAIAYVAKCKTDVDALKTAYNTLHQTQEMLNHTSAKLTSVMDSHDRMSSRIIEAMTCSAWEALIEEKAELSHSINGDTSSTTNVVSINRAARSVDILTVLTQRIVSATVTPACNSTELAWLEEHQANITVGGTQNIRAGNEPSRSFAVTGEGSLIGDPLG